MVTMFTTFPRFIVFLCYQFDSSIVDSLFSFSFNSAALQNMDDTIALAGNFIDASNYAEAVVEMERSIIDVDDGEMLSYFSDTRFPLLMDEQQGDVSYDEMLVSGYSHSNIDLTHYLTHLLPRGRSVSQFQNLFRKTIFHLSILSVHLSLSFCRTGRGKSTSLTSTSGWINTRARSSSTWLRRPYGKAR
jgi:hypothetical protein